MFGRSNPQFDGQRTVWTWKRGVVAYRRQGKMRFGPLAPRMPKATPHAGRKQAPSTSRILLSFWHFWGFSERGGRATFRSSRVRSSMGSAAIDGSVLMATAGSRPTSSLPPALVGAESFTDAEVMLRVKAGDESAFDYLVQKYRRPLVSFMYRMARNTAAAEDLAQEVFLRVYRSRQTYKKPARSSRHGCIASRRTWQSTMRVTRGTSGRK